MGHILTKEEWMKMRRRKRLLRLGAVSTLAVLVVILCFFSLKGIISLVMGGEKDKTAGSNGNSSTSGLPGDISPTPPLSGTPTTEPSGIPESENSGIPAGLPDKLKDLKVEEMFLTPNEYSRPQKKLEEVTGIVIHYVANKGTTAKSNRNYFDSLATLKTTSASSHFIVGLEGEIVQCIPLNEWAYATTKRNKDTISIECCHPEEDGKFNTATYESVTALTAALCDAYNLKTSAVIRHYDVTGKLCPKYYIDNGDTWNQFLKDVDAKRDKITNSK